VLVPGSGARRVVDAASKPIFIEGRTLEGAAASMGVSCAMLVDTDGVCTSLGS